MNIIAAIDEENCIGKDNSLLAHLPCDLRYFKERTLNEVVVMGYNTYLSLPVKPLPQRVNIVLTTKRISLEGVIVVNSLDSALKIIKDYEKNKQQVFICGGGLVFNQFIEYADTLYITKIMHEFKGDTFFPKIDNSKWILTESFCRSETLNHEYPYRFLVYKRKKVFS